MLHKRHVAFHLTAASRTPLPKMVTSLLINISFFENKHARLGLVTASRTPGQHVRDDAGHSSSAITDRYVNVELKERANTARNKTWGEKV